MTVARLAATPVLVLIILRATPSWGALSFWAALAFSDFADGWLARRRGPSASGAFLDPLADKFLVLGALAAMVSLGKITWPARGPARRAGGRDHRLPGDGGQTRGQRAGPRVAKAKTLVEFFTVGLVLLPVAWSSRLTLSHAALWLAVVLAWASAAQYLFDSRSGRRAVAPGT